MAVGNRLFWMGFAASFLLRLCLMLDNKPVRGVSPAQNLSFGLGYQKYVQARNRLLRGRQQCNVIGRLIEFCHFL
jgi:hypothetical protein